MKCVYGRAGVRYVITKFSRVDSLPNFLTCGAPLRCARFARAGAPLLENRRSSQGVRTPCTPLDPPLIIGSVEVAYAVPSFDENYFV